MDGDGTQERTLVKQMDYSILEQVVATGDLSKLSPEQRTKYYVAVCDSLGVNPLTKPFQYIILNNKLVLYATRDCTDQLRHTRKINIEIVSREVVNGVYVVTTRASTVDGRTDESIGAVNIDNLRGDALANAMMKAETKSKRRVTLSICGLGILDESEIETIPDARFVTADDRPAPLPVATTPGPDDISNQNQETARPASSHWIEDPATRARFWSYTNKLGLTQSQVHEALNVDEIHKFAGSKEDARRKIENFVDSRAAG